MQNRHRNSLAALLAVGLLVLAGLSSTALARGQGHPGDSVRPHPTSHPDPSSKPTPKVHPSPKPEPSKGHKLPDCKPSATTSASSASTSADTSASVVLKDDPELAAKKIGGGKTLSGLSDKVHGRMLEVACSIDGLRTATSKHAANDIRSLQRLLAKVATSKTLTDSERATLTAELNGLIAQLQVLKAKIDAETTLEGLQADSTALSTLFRSFGPVVKQVNLVMAADSVIAAGPKFEALETRLASLIAAAPAGTDTSKAQALLDDIKKQVAEAESLVGSLPATLLALTTAQLQAGAGDQVLKDARTALEKARKDLRTAQKDAHAITQLFDPKLPGGKDDHKSASPAPSAKTASML